MNNEELTRWFEAQKQAFETAYLAGTLPWQQSGFGLHTPRSAQDWEALRRPIADCIENAGTFLDIGCANVETLDKIARVLKVSVADLIEHVPDQDTKQ